MTARTRRTPLVGAVVAALVIGGGSAASAGGAAAGPAAGCSATAPPVAAAGPLGRGPVVSGGVVELRLCRYGPLPDRALQGQHLTRSQTGIASLARLLNALLPVSPGPTNCPNDDGSEVVLHARYRSGRTATVTIGLSGCRTATRGRVARSAGRSPGGAALVAQLVRLTP